MEFTNFYKFAYFFTIKYDFHRKWHETGWECYRFLIC